jgi:uncharacterized protein
MALMTPDASAHRGGTSIAGRARPASWGRALFLGIALLAVGTVAAAAMNELQFFRIGTAATTGTYFQIGGVLASAITKPPGSRDCERGGSCGVAGLVAVAQASQGSIQNVLAVNAGQLESALAQSDISYWAALGSIVAPRRCGTAKDEAARAATGTALLKKSGPAVNLRAIAALYPEDIHIVVRADSAIAGLRDLKGKRVALGEPESGTLADARLVLEAAGLSECEVKAEYLRLSEAANGLGEGKIDAFFLVGGYPVPAITDIAATVPTRLLPVPHDIAERLVAKYPFFGIDAIPAGTYPGIDTETQTLSLMALWVVRADLDETLIHDVTKSLWSDATKRMLETTHPAGRRIHIASALDGIAIPLHPGAARFYREAGIKLPEGQ